MQEAYYCYSRWGAKAKVAALESRYPHLLQPILTPKATAGWELTSLDAVTAFSNSIYTGNRHSSSGTNLNQALDLTSILQAAKAISGTIHLEELLRQLTQIMLQNSGGDRCALCLPSSGEQSDSNEWEIRVITTAQETTLCNEPLEKHPGFPSQLIYYVKHKRELLALDATDPDLPVLDTYLHQKQPRSILCLPLMHQNALVGILYLQNQAVKGVFTQERLTVLTFLCAQAAVSLENATLYQRLEDYNQVLEVQVADRTQALRSSNAQLQQTLDRLQQTQSQLIQSERMSALGKMVAGVAHEINNPNNFIYGNLNHAKDYFRDLLELIDLYDAEDSSDEDIINLKEEIEIDFLREDISSLLTSMHEGSSRIHDVVNGLKRFSGLDEAEYKKANLVEGLESTLLMLHHHFTLVGGKRSIQIVKEYGEIPPLFCYPSALNQAFFNIISNAVDALKLTGSAGDPRIIIRASQLEDESVQVIIEDNGPGIPQALQEKIFTPFFTTKPVGEGTGLGLAVAYQTVVETHGGTLEVQSEVDRGARFDIRLPLR